MKRIIIIVLFLSACADAAQEANQRSQRSRLAPETPKNFLATPQSNEITLIWTPVESATQYEIYWEDTGANSGVITVVESPYTHQGLINKRGYDYRIRAENNIGYSPFSGGVSAIPDDYKTLYVSATALDDSGDGLSPENARLTINAAIATATAPATILVSEGLYTVQSHLRTHIQLKDAVSLYGGYSADFSDRNPSRYITTITDSPVPNINREQFRAVEAGRGITRATVIDGFTINGSLQSPVYSRAIWLRDGAGPIIQNNIIYSGNGLVSQAITDTGGQNSIIQNNIIRAEERVISLAEGTVIIRNNTLIGQYAISGSQMTMTIENNIIISRGAGASCILNARETRPVVIRNNNLWGCPVAYRTGTDYTLAGMEIATGATGNVSVDSLFLSAFDWHLSVSTPLEITAGGLNGIDEAWGFSTDKDGANRPESGTPWAMGAYEP